MSFGARLKRMRLDKGLTQRQLAAPRYTAAFVSTVESGRRQPSRAALAHFAKRLEIDPDELATGVSKGERVAAQGRLQEARKLLANGELDEALTTALEVERLAREQVWPSELAKALVIQALAAEQKGHIDDAIGLYEAAEDAVRNESPLEAVDALVGRCRCIQLTGDIRYAVHLLEMHLRVLREMGLEEPSALTRIYTSLVAAYFDAGLQRQAEETARLALELAPRVSDLERVAGMHINAARVLFEKGLFDEARRSLDKAEELFGILGQKNDLGRVYLARAFSLIGEDRPEEALFDLERAASIFRETGNALNETRSVLQTARVLRITERAPEARLLLQGIQLAEMGGPTERAIARRELGLCFAQEGSFDAAVENLQEAIDLLEPLDDAREVALTYRVLGDLMKGLDELADACDAYRNAAMALENAA